MQIFDRISRILKSYSTQNHNEKYGFIEDEDDELKRIIEELNSDSKNDNYSENPNNNSHSAKSNLYKYYEILGINDNADFTKVKEAYRKKMKEYHPDKFAGMDINIRNKAEAKAKDINEAYNKIKQAKGK